MKISGLLTIFGSDERIALENRIAMQLMVSRSQLAIDAQTLVEYVTRDALFRAADGSYFLYMTSMSSVESEERIIFLDCRDALLWLNETPDALGSYWHFAECEKRRYRPQNIVSNALFQCTGCPSH